MINREQILQMIAGYGTNLQHWPVANQQELSEYIAADTELSLALSKAASDELMLKESFALSEPQWSAVAEKSLAEKINDSVATTQEAGKKSPWWQLIIQRFTDPAQVLQAFPTVVAMLLLMVVVQVVYKDEPIQVAVTYSNEEFQDWLVFEGINDIAEMEQNAGLIRDSANNDLGELPEFVYYL